jgi:hypothetical protein
MDNTMTVRECLGLVLIVIVCIVLILGSMAIANGVI